MKSKTRKAAGKASLDPLVRCETCKYWDHYEDVEAVDKGRTSYGRCRRYPAQYMPDADDGDGEDPWYKWNQPAMFNDEWCGEHTPNARPEPERSDRLVADVGDSGGDA